MARTTRARDLPSQPPRPVDPDSFPKHLEVHPIEAPPADQRRSRDAVFAVPGEKRTRYSLPVSVSSSSPVGYRTRVSLTLEQAQQAMRLLALDRPTGFVPGPSLTDRELFEECSLGILTSRQSTNFRGHTQVTFGPKDSERLGHLLRSLLHREADVLDDAGCTHLVFSRPYRTPFTLLLTFVGHQSLTSLATVAKRAWNKRFRHVDDIPTIGYLQHLHLGILAEAMERATVIASQGKRKAQIFIAPLCGQARVENKPIVRAIEDLAGLTAIERGRGWRLALVAQTGHVAGAEQIDIEPATYRRIGANLVAFRSERIQPGVNAEEKAPAPYHGRQDMDVPDQLTVMAGRAAYNAFAHWAGCGRERAKDLLLLERVDVLSPNGKQRLRQLRDMLMGVTDRVVETMPLWADLPTGKALSRNANRSRKAFALVGQRIYLSGLSRPEVLAAEVDWQLALRAVGAAATRGALYSELMGVTDIPADCDMLAGICMMAGPVNQNDVGKQFYGHDDMLLEAFPDRNPTALLVWTLKAKTVADPIGNEEQLLNPKRKGALVDLRAGPHEIIQVRRGGKLEKFRSRGGRVSQERAFGDIGNFVTDPNGQGIPGNRGSPWPRAWADEELWPT